MIEFIDVSKWQGGIDWKAVAQTSIKGVITRAIDAEQSVDPTLLINLKWARATGFLWTGAYHNLVDGSISAQVGRFVNAIPDWRGVIPMVDSEQGASFRQLEQFAAAIKVELGVYPLIYLPRWYWESLPDRGPIHPEWTWVHSRYASEPGPLIPPLSSLNGHVWQYSSTGRVPGVTGNVDLNRYYGPEEVLLQLAAQ